MNWYISRILPLFLILMAPALIQAMEAQYAQDLDRAIAESLWEQEEREVLEEVMRLSLQEAHRAPAKPAQIKQQNANRGKCNICFDEKERLYATSECKHAYCSECLTHHIDAAIAEKSSQNLKCPECRKDISQPDVQRITKSRQKAEQVADILMKEWALQNKGKVKACPTPNCPNYFEVVNRGTISCTACHKVYCSECLNRHSEKVSCEEAANAASHEEDEETKKWKKEHTKACPKCHASIEKNGGCKHMICYNKNCGYQFCWDCLVAWDNRPEGHGYYDCNNNAGNFRNIFMRF